MSSPSLNILRILWLQIERRLLSSALIVLALMACGQADLAQSIQSRPVARLISAPHGNPTLSRPRRVSDAISEVATPVSSGPTLEQATTIERRAFEETNVARVKYGFPALEWDSQLCLMARQHSESMGQQLYFDHETPEGLEPKHRARALGLRFRVLGENIAYNKDAGDPGAFAVERWMISPGHRANILYIGFQSSAVGSYVSTDGSVYLTQVFISR